METNSSSDATAPFFIVSSGRAGTTLLSVILNRSSSVFVPPESDFIARAFPFYQDKVIEEKDYNKLSRLFVHTSQPQWLLTPEELKAALTKSQPDDFRKTNVAIYEYYLKKNNISNCQWGIKRPVLIASIPRIKKVFPESRIIHLVRDGRDVFLSYRNVHRSGRKFGPKNLVTCALYWVDALRRINEQADIMEIRYEDLLLQSERIIKNVCGFLKMEYHEDMITQYYRDSKSLSIVSNDHSESIHKKLTDGIDSSNLNKHEKDMNWFELFIFELIAGCYLRKYGYEVHFPFLNSAFSSLFRIPLYGLARFFNNVRYCWRDYKVYEKVKGI